jgi:NDP-sugar pyrophosphorylase family protein
MQEGSTVCRYKESSVICSSAGTFRDLVCVGSGSCIEGSAQVSSSVIGRNCRIEDDAVVFNSFLLGGVFVGRGGFLLASPLYFLFLGSRGLSYLYVCLVLNVLDMRVLKV